MMSKIHRFRFSPKVMVVADEKGNTIAEAHPKKVAALIYGGRTKDVGIVPPALRWLAANGSAAIIERPPHQRHIVFKQSSGADKTYKMWLPWLLWAVQFDGPNWNKITGVAAFARSYPLASERDVLGLLPFPGVKPNGRIKMPPGASMSGELAAGLSFGSVLDRVPDLYFGQIFDDSTWKLEEKHVPQNWPTTPAQIMETMAKLDKTGVTYTEYKSSDYETFGQLIEELEPPTQQTPDALEYLGEMVIQAGVKK